MNQKVIDALNAARMRELGAVTQYLAQHYELEDKMYGKLADRLKDIGIQEMKHAEKFAERILFLGGVPSSKPDVVAQKGQSIPDMLQTDMGLEEAAVLMYNDSAKLCRAEGDNASADLFEEILQQEEDHLDEFQNKADFVRDLGQAYLATLVE
jgi:bacterioferritin